jgi:hypothetical protein
MNNFNPSRYKGEFKTEKFKIFELPMYNKKTRRHLKIQHLPIRIVTLARGFLGKKFIQRTRPVTYQEIESDGKFIRFQVEGGAWYRAPIVGENHGERI